MTATTNAKQKLCFVIPSLNGGGAERILINLANHFSQLNYNSLIISLNKSCPAYNIDKEVMVFNLTDRKSDSMAFRLYYIFQMFFKLLFIVYKEKPAYVVSFITSANLWAGLAATIANVPYIVSERTSPARSLFKLNYLNRALAAIIYKHAAAIVVSTKGIGDSLKNNRAFSKVSNIKLIPNALSQFEPVSPKEIHPRKFVLGVGRLTYVKGFDQLISAFGAAKLRDTDLLIIGEGNERAALIDQIKNLGLTEVVFMPGSRVNLQDYYSQAELFILPSRNEGYPNALIEAMSFGCPPVAMNCDFGPSEIIQNEHNGLLVETGNILALTNAIIRLSNDFELKKKISANAKRINQTNRVQIIFKKWAQLFSVSTLYEAQLFPKLTKAT
ncbi:glycosyltransferase family 4 protein [Mucilaginibacter sp. UR6-11]|uniref:glycosyltransferase family 4 protein n=1 Tax=Mucilaginibacter sp. UR6-11 TaxID=1435644 RepID=UPI001E2DAEBC|nr:glycosyltransferase family 4 protein [Mucilaginibacter sp. UR6-11]MCC8426375.1 glycosyltransferase family 4 protein [Mucilaginibacter sp. UR6-11]